MLNKRLNDKNYTKLLFVITYFMSSVLDWELLEDRQKYPQCPSEDLAHSGLSVNPFGWMYKLMKKRGHPK